MTLAVGSHAYHRTEADCGCSGTPEQPPAPVPQTQEPMADYRPTGQADIACGITTAYRPQTGPRDEGHGPTLTRCLTSVCAVDILPTVFAEPGSCLAGVAEWVPVVERDCKLGIFRNWARMTEALLDTGLPFVMTLQDDCELSPSAMVKVREFIASWPDKAAMLSLYTPPVYESRRGGFSAVDQKRHSSGKLLGAVGWLFKRETLLRVRDTKSVCGTPKIRQKVDGIKAKYPRSSITAGWCQSNRLDIAVGQGLQECRLRCWVHTPSLSQHVAEDSTVGHPPASRKGVHAEAVL